jgi:hypothetical protein
VRGFVLVETDKGAGQNEGKFGGSIGRTKLSKVVGEEV